MNKLLDDTVYVVKLCLYLAHPRELKGQFFSDFAELVFYHRQDVKPV